MPARLGLTYVAKTTSPERLKLMGALAFIPAIFMFMLWFTNSRQTAPEAGGVVWWNWARPIHASLILLFAISAVTGN